VAAGLGEEALHTDGRIIVAPVGFQKTIVSVLWCFVSIANLPLQKTETYYFKTTTVEFPISPACVFLPPVKGSSKGPPPDLGKAAEG